MEARIPTETREALAQRGHVVHTWQAIEPEAGGVCMITRGPSGAALAGGADLRRTSYAVGW